MKMRVCLSAMLLAAATTAWCQDGMAPPPGRGHGQRDRRGGEGRGAEGRGPEGRDGLPGRPPELLPPGTWWRNPEVVKALTLTDDQRKRIEEAFRQSRMALVDMHATLEKQELVLEPLMNAQPFDQAKALAAIAKIADTRAELEKTNAKMLLGIRAVLSQEQWQKLRAGGPGAAGTGGGQRGVGGAPRGKVGWAGAPPPQ